MAPNGFYKMMSGPSVWHTPGSSLTATGQGKKYSYATLDNVPEFATRSMGQLYSMIFGRFEHYDGVIIYGPRSCDWPDNGYWGRSMVLHTQELLQIRYWPNTLLSDGEKDPPQVRIAAKVTGPDGDSHVSTFVGFQKSAFCNSKEEIKISVVETQARITGCRGLHVFMASLFKRHNVPQTLPSGLSARTMHDRFGYESLRATSYSIHKVDKKHLEKTMDHAGACAASPGTSVLMIAGELVDVHLEPTGGRVCQPIAQKKWKDNATFIKTEILQNPRGEIAGIQAIGAATCIVDMLSAEGLVGMHAGEFFKGALPDRLAGPHGMPLTLAMAVNFAINWNTYGLPRPSVADQHANDQLRMILQTSGYGPLPGVESNQWCIDVVVRGALNVCKPEVDELKRARGIACTAKLAVVDDSKTFWQRVGQRLITTFFGLGAVVPRQHAEKGGHGTAWRIADPLQLARDRHLAGAGTAFEGLDEPMVEPPASFGARKAALVAMLNSVEQWLRCGEHKNLTLTPRGSPEVLEEHMQQIRAVLSDMMAPKMMKDLVAKIGRMGHGEGGAPPQATGTSYEQSVADAMQGHFHLPSMGCAITDCKEALLHGPSQHFKYMTGAYVVAATQVSPCSDCLAPVHVLQGIMIANAYAECTACHAKRCIPCSDAYAKAVRVSESQRVGKRCRICGAEPAWIEVTKAFDHNGDEMMQIHLGERTPTQTDSNLVSDGPVSHAVSAASASKGNKKKSKAEKQERKVAEISEQLRSIEKGLEEAGLPLTS